jgi:uncharacterized protein
MKQKLGIAVLTILTGLGYTEPAKTDIYSEIQIALEEAAVAEKTGDSAAEVKAVTRLAELGESWAQVLLGQMYLQGDDVVQSDKVALSLFLKAANPSGHTDIKPNGLGNPKGQYMLGIMYYQGRGVTLDRVEAYKWLTIASSTDHDEDFDSIRIEAKEARETLKLEMTRSQITEAESLSLKWFRGE